MTKKKVAKQRIAVGREFNMRTRSPGATIYVDMPPRTPKAIFEAAKKANKRFDLSEVIRLKDDRHYEWEIIVNDENYTRTDEDFPSTFQAAKDEREGHEKWVKKNLGRKWTIDHHEKGLYSILKTKSTKRVKRVVAGRKPAEVSIRKKDKPIKKKDSGRQDLRRPVRNPKAVPIRFKETVGKPFPEIKKEAKIIPTRQRNWDSLAFTIVEKYGRKMGKGYGASLAGILLRVVVPLNQGDRIGKNLSSQVAKYKKRHGLKFKTRMERTRVTIGGKAHITFLIRKL